VNVINPATNKIIANITVGSLAYYLLFDPSNQNMYATRYGAMSVTVINSSTNSAYTIGSGKNGHQAPNGQHFLEFNPVNNDIYASNIFNRTISIVSGSSNTIVANITVGIDPRYVEYDSINSEVFVANAGSGTVSVISS